MRHLVRYLLYSLLIILLATACSSEPEDILPTTGVFGFSVDPVSQTVTLNGLSAESLSTQRTSDEPRVLTPSELAIETFDFAFLPGNLLRIEASFINTTKLEDNPLAFRQLSFRPTRILSTFASSTEPTVTDADLGGDGVLNPNEVTSPLVFEVEHFNEYFTYAVEATALATTVESEEVCSDPSDRVVIPDPGFRQVIESQFATSPVTCADMQSLTALTLRGDRFPGSTISSLVGLETATNLKSLEISELDAADPVIISKLTNLEALKIRESSLTDITPFSNLTKLRSLDLGINQISNLTPLSNLNLEVLALFINQIADVSPIANMKSLRELALSGNPITSDVTFSDLPNLQTLTLGGPKMGSLALSNLPMLSYISLFEAAPKSASISGLNSLQSLSIGSDRLSEINLSNLPILKTLQLRGNQLTDISTLSNLPNLTDLSIAGNQLSDISVLSNLANLQLLTVSQSLVSDISALDGLTTISYLYIADNQINNISALDGLTELIYLQLDNNQVSDISALSSLTNLKDLYLKNNQVSNISPLNNLRNLDDLELANNQISDVTALTALTRIGYLGLSTNRISDIAPLVANGSLGDNLGERVDLSFNCLDLSEGTEDLANIQNIENRYPGRQNVFSRQDAVYFDANCNQ